MADPRRTKDQILLELSNASAMRGWDCFLGMSMEKLGKILEAQYNSATPNIPRHVQQTTQVKVARPQATLSVEANFYCGPARCAPSTDNDKVRLIFEILEHDPENPGNKSSFKQTQIDPPSEDPPYEAFVTPGTTFSAIVPIKVLAGESTKRDAWFQLLEANPVNSIYSFESNGHNITDPALATAISQIFTSLQYRYKWFTLDPNPAPPVSPDLVPAHFNFNSYVNSRGTGVLCLYIATTSSPPDSPTLAISNPLPESGGIDTIVLIHNRIAANILKTAFDADATFPWQMQTIKGSGDLGFDKIQSGGNSSLPVLVSPVGNVSFNGNLVTVPLHPGGGPGFVISPTAGQRDIVGTLSSTFEQKVQLKPRGKFEAADLTVRFDPVPFQINATQNDSSKFTLSYNFLGTSLNVDAKSTKIPEPALQRVEENFGDKFRMIAATAVAQARFEPVSTFVLKTLTFPGGNYVRLTGANQPGELVLWGNLINDSA